MAKKEILNNDVVTLRVGETAADILEQAVEETEKALDIIENTAERVVTVTKSNPFLVVGALLVGIGIGGFVAYKITQKKLSAEFDQELGEQIAEAKAFHSRVRKEGEFETPEGAVQALVPPEDVVTTIRTYQGREEAKRVPYDKPDEIVEVIDPRPPVEVVVEEVVVNNNVFIDAKNDPRDWDYNLEIADREANPDQPYVISFEEFTDNPENNEQTTLTYYAQDDTLSDTQDQPIDNSDYIVGDDNLQRFGHGSHDKHVVYIRNERIGSDFEVNRSMGSYQQEVLGHTPELKHSHRRPNRRSWRAEEE